MNSYSDLHHDGVDYAVNIGSESIVLINSADIKTASFEGPLDLLCYLIEKNKLNIYDIPIVEVTDQYIEYLSELKDIDLELTSEFLVMASTLLIIKSKMLLPIKDANKDNEGFDPREELVLKLLEYRRCKSLAEELRMRHAQYQACVYKQPESTTDLGIEKPYVSETLSSDSFYTICGTISERNKIRFFDVSNRILHMLKRDKISLKDKMKLIWERIVKNTKVFFNEIFPADSTSKSERVIGFLALLELLKTDKLRVLQSYPFDVISIEHNPDSKDDTDPAFEKNFTKNKLGEINYL